jgi:hypothetical protein
MYERVEGASSMASQRRDLMIGDCSNSGDYSKTGDSSNGGDSSNSGLIADLFAQHLHNGATQVEYRIKLPPWQQFVVEKTSAL